MTHRRHQNPAGPSGHRPSWKFWPALARRLAKSSWLERESAMPFRTQLNLKSLLQNLKKFLKRNRRSRTLRRRRKSRHHPRQTNRHQ